MIDFGESDKMIKISGKVDKSNTYNKNQVDTKISESIYIYIYIYIWRNDRFW